MSYRKITVINGNNTVESNPFDINKDCSDWEEWKDTHSKQITRRGFVSRDNAQEIAKKHGLVGTVLVYHCVLDLSGKGRGGTENEFEITL